MYCHKKNVHGALLLPLPALRGANISLLPLPRSLVLLLSQVTPEEVQKIVVGMDDPPVSGWWRVRAARHVVRSDDRLWRARRCVGPFTPRLDDTRILVNEKKKKKKRERTGVADS